MKTTNNILAAVIGVIAFSTVICGGKSTPQRRIPEGALIPEFQAIDITGKPFVCTQSGGKTLVLAFLSSEQKNSRKAIEDIFRILPGIPSDKLTSLQVAFVLQNVDNRQFIASIQKEAPSVVRILDDDQYNIWGKFGVIATPTVLISNRQGTVLCVKPGHTYDFAQVVKSRLFQALEIPSDVSPSNTPTVRTVANSTMSAKAKRHLQMARLLSGKSKISSAVEQAEIAYEIDPNSPEVVLDLGELLCRAGQAQKAIKLVSSLSGQSDRDKARINLIMGWAKRQLKQPVEAEKHLMKGINQDPMLPRLYFELGRIFQKRNDSENAMQAYFQALQLIYHEE
ncbi:MAG: tetratricopeptide repeat protein [Planctomycetota bacterium]|jgi:tetratricopeptide (TPR) repeat protein